MMQNKSEINISNTPDANITVNVTQITNPFELKEKKDHLETTKKYFAKLTLSDEDYLSTSQKIEELESAINLYEKTLQDTAKVLESEKDNKDFEEVRKYIEQGNIDLARKWFEDNKDELSNEEKRLNEKRQTIANKYLTWALLTRTDYDNPNWFADTCNYFELSIKASAKKDNLWWYAYFLTTNYKFEQAELIYKKILSEFSNECSDKDFAGIHNNLASFYSTKNQQVKAIKQYQKSLSIYKNLAKINPLVYEPCVAMVLTNIATCYQRLKGSYKKALNLYDEAIIIFEQNKINNSTFCLSQIAMQLNNKGVLYLNNNQINLALNCFNEALAINQDLVIDDFPKYLIDYAISLIHLADFHQRKIINREISIVYAIKCLTILLPYVEKMSHTAELYVNALNILNNWGFSDEEIEKIIEEAKSDEL